MALTKIDDRGLTTPIDLLDNEKIRFGTGNDLEAYHSSSDNNSYIQHTQNGTSLIVKSDYFIVSENQSTDIVMRAAAGVAELYNNNVKKLETTANGISVSAGAADTTSVLQVSSSGSGRADMRITASGTGAANLFLDAANGDLSGADYVGIFQDNDLDFCIQNYGGDVTLKTRGGTLGSGDIDNAIVCKQEGTVEVYYNNSKKLETITNGVKVHTNLYAQGAGEISLAIGSTDAGSAAIYFDGDSNGDWSGGDYSRIRHTTAGDMEYDADNPAGATNHIFMTAGTERLKVKSNGHVSIASGNLEFASGAGVDFSNVSDGSRSVTSNLLADYEEGTWTPAFGGLDSVSHSTQFGRYTKIGRQVFCTATIDATGIDESNNITLTGLPYTSVDNNDNKQRSTWLVAYGGHCSGISDATARFRSNGSSWQGVKGTGNTSYCTGAELSSSGSVNITGSFSFYV